MNRYLIVPSFEEEKYYLRTIIDSISYIGSKHKRGGQSNIYYGRKYISSKVSGCNPNIIRNMTKNHRVFFASNDDRAYIYKVHKELYTTILSLIIEELSRDINQNAAVLRTRMKDLLRIDAAIEIKYTNALVYETVIALRDLSYNGSRTENKDTANIILTGIDKIPNDSKLKHVIQM